MMQLHYNSSCIEAGCDEAGRGCLAGPVFAAAVILPPDFREPRLRDSKKLSPSLRYELREIILSKALAWGVGMASPAEIDRLNILRASFLAMHRAIEKLAPVPDLLLIDGNRFAPYKDIPYQCIVRGDDLLAPVAAASVLAKTFRDDYMVQLHDEFPQYGWNKNKGYPTLFHRQALTLNGPSPHHRKSFLHPVQKELFT